MPDHAYATTMRIYVRQDSPDRTAMPAGIGNAIIGGSRKRLEVQPFASRSGSSTIPASARS